jgi:uncharacterized paraquat-inducible protein A
MPYVGEQEFIRAGMMPNEEPMCPDCDTIADLRYISDDYSKALAVCPQCTWAEQVTLEFG